MKRHARTIEQLAQILGKSRSQLILYGQRGCPCTRRDKTTAGYLIAPIRKWCEDRGYLGTTVVKANGHGGPVDPSGCTARQRLLEAQAREREEKARVAEFQRRQLEGELISRADVEDHDRKRHLYMIRTLRMWARSLGPVLAGKTAIGIQGTLEEKVDSLMRVFSGERDEL